MSYAQQAGKGPKQSAEDARAPIPPQLEQSTSSSMVEIDGEQIKRDASDTANKAKDEASSAADKTSQKASEAADKTSQKGTETAETLKKKAKEAADYTQEKGKEFGDSAGKNYEKTKKEVEKDGKKIKAEVQREGNELYDNRDNPVVIVNGVLMAATAVALGVGGYQKYQAGQLDWQLAGAAGLVVGILGVGDYYLSQWLFENKYPKK